MPQDPRQKAAALRYDRERDNAPVLVAKGSGKVAERILAVAEEHGIPLYQDPDLVEVLAALDLGQMIPEDLYQAVAEVLAFVYQMNQEYAQSASK